MWISEPACLAAPSCIVQAQDQCESQLSFVLPIHHHAWNQCTQHACDELRQFPISQHRRFLNFPYINLLEYFASRCQRLDEHRLLITDTIRYGVEIFQRQCEVLGVSPWMPDDPEYGPPRAVRIQSAPAKVADRTPPKCSAGN